MNLPEKMIDALFKAAELIRSYGGTVRLITHYDGDGLSSAGILAKSFMREGVSFHFSATKNATPSIEEFMRETSSELIVLADLGTALVEDLEALRRKRKLGVVIVDHHDTAGRDSPVMKEDFVEINPRYYDYDGTREASASTISFLLSLALRGDNLDLGVYALAGAGADKQLQEGAKGINKTVADYLVGEEMLRKEVGVRLPGESLERALYLAVEPYFPGMSGRSPAVRRFLKELGIKGEWSFEELPEEKCISLNSALYLYLLKRGVRHEIAKLMFREIYWASLRGERVDVEDVGYEINAAGRAGEYSVGVGYVLGDEESRQRARGLRQRYREEILQRMLQIEEKGGKVLQNIQYIEVDRDVYAGTLAGLCMQYLFDPEKPTIAVTRAGDEVRISARGTWYLVKRGLDLASALREAAEGCGGRGGGHNIAAGATIPAEKLQEFLRRLDKAVGSQMEG